MGRGKADSGEQDRATASLRTRKPGPRVIDAKNSTIELGSYVIDEDGRRLQAKDFFAPDHGLRKVIFLTESGEEETFWAEETMRGNYKISRFRLA